jgi:hypothetical protein
MQPRNRDSFVMDNTSSSQGASGVPKAY